MPTFDSLAAKYGTYTKDGVDYTLEQDAYPDTNAGSGVIGGIIMPGENYYTAAGFDRAGNSVNLVWAITNADTDDAGDACNWDEFEIAPSFGDPAPWTE